MANIDSSSTAQLTLNAAMTRPTRSTRDSNNSDSDPDRSPSVTVITADNNDTRHIHLHHPFTRPAHLMTGGFSLTNRFHLSKHQRNVWTGANSFERLLMVAVLVLAATTLLLIISLITILVSQRHQFELQAQNNSEQSRKLDSDHQVIELKSSAHALDNYTMIITASKEKKYCLTPDCVKVAASVIEAIDLTVDPCDDFYVGAN